MEPSPVQIAIILAIGWVACFALGWQAREVVAKLEKYDDEGE